MKVDKSGFLQGNDGICAVIIHKKRVLLIKRHWFPLIRNPNIWSLLFGGRKKSDTHLSTAYREIAEETGLGREKLKLLSKPTTVKIFDTKNQSKWWKNRFFIFESNSEKIKLDMENVGYKWADIDDIKKSRWYTNIFVDKEKIEQLIERAIGGK